MARTHLHARAFTVAELVITSGILASISFIAMAWLTGVSDLWWTTTTQSQVRVDVEMALRRVTGELRSASRTAGASPPNLVIPASPNNTSVMFYLPADVDGNGSVTDAIGALEWGVANPIQYVYVPAAKQLQRIEGGQTRIIANGVTDVRFIDAAVDPSLYANEVRVTLSLQSVTPQQRTLSATATSTVKLRN